MEVIITMENGGVRGSDVAHNSGRFLAAVIGL
jgi:hypothetical protein